MDEKALCIQELDKLMTDLRAQGMDTSSLLAALTETIVKVATSETGKADGYLENIIAVLAADAQSLRAAGFRRVFKYVVN